MSDGNREYKSDVFSMLLEDKENALSVYNVLNGSSITDSSLVEMKTLDGGISLSVRNDAAFIVDASLSIYEHQSTVCPNMPVRSLIYFTLIIEKYVKQFDIYGRKLVKIPVPKFVVFYNGQENQPEQYELKLSDAFERKVDDPQLELKCKVYNINDGKNADILKNCKVLRDYMAFVDYVRSYHKEQNYDNLKMAINKAIDRCIRDGILVEFFDDNREKVVKAMALDYTFERRILLAEKDARSEGLEEGHAKGLEEGRAEGRAEGKAEAYAEIKEELAQKDAEIERLKKLLAVK